MTLYERQQIESDWLSMPPGIRQASIDWALAKLQHISVQQDLRAAKRASRARQGTAKRPRVPANQIML
jgi:hypothetical protein